MREEHAGQNDFVQPKFYWVSFLPQSPSSLEISLEEKRKTEKLFKNADLTPREIHG